MHAHITVTVTVENKKELLSLIQFMSSGYTTLSVKRFPLSCLGATEELDPGV
jgi:hypothetical protein